MISSFHLRHSHSKTKVRSDAKNKSKRAEYITDRYARRKVNELIKIIRYITLTEFTYLSVPHGMLTEPYDGC